MSLQEVMLNVVNFHKIYLILRIKFLYPCELQIKFFYSCEPFSTHFLFCYDLPLMCSTDDEHDPDKCSESSISEMEQSSDDTAQETAASQIPTPSNLMVSVAASPRPSADSNGTQMGE